NIPGLEALDKADLVVMLLRFRDLPDEQMKHIVDYVEAGKPIVGMRTATHAFNIKKGKTYEKYSWNNGEWKGGFGKQVLGETWVTHHAHPGQEPTGGITAEGQEKNPIVRGIKYGDIFGPTDVYPGTLPLPDGCKPLVMGEVVAGMKQDDPPVIGKK